MGTVADKDQTEKSNPNRLIVGESALDYLAAFKNHRFFRRFLGFPQIYFEYIVLEALKGRFIKAWVAGPRF